MEKFSKASFNLGVLTHKFKITGRLRLDEAIEYIKCACIVSQKPDDTIYEYINKKHNLTLVNNKLIHMPNYLNN